MLCCTSCTRSQLNTKHHQLKVRSYVSRKRASSQCMRMSPFITAVDMTTSAGWSRHAAYSWYRHRWYYSTPGSVSPTLELCQLPRDKQAALIRLNASCSRSALSRPACVRTHISITCQGRPLTGWMMGPGGRTYFLVPCPSSRPLAC